MPRPLLACLAILLAATLTFAQSATAPSSAPTSQPASQPATNIPAAFAGPPTGFPKDAKTGNLNKLTLDAKPFSENKNAWFHLAVPKNYSPKEAFPLVIVLHGGPAGNGPDDITTFFRACLTANGCISAYPNALEKILLAWNYPDAGDYLLAIIHQIAATYRIDPTRIYLVGVSMGGGGAWAQGSLMHDVWAGIGPISGWYKPTPAPPAEGLKNIPIYCLHGEKDEAVTVERARLAKKEMKTVGHDILDVTNINDLKGLGQETMVYREIAGVGHNVFLPWNTLGRVELGKMLAWLTAHQRKTPADLDAAQKSLDAWRKKTEGK